MNNATLILTLCALLVAPGTARAANDTAANVSIDRQRLVDRRFQFSWQSDEGGGVNGIAVLRPDGSIEGIASPNESAWALDSANHLLFQHADGRISTRFDRVWMVEGRLRLKGMFLFREGISHQLIELEGPDPAAEHRITPEQEARIKYSRQRLVYLDPGEKFAYRLRNGAERRVRLVSVAEEKDLVIGLIRRAQIEVEIDGKPVALVCAPYRMPTEIAGLRIQADTTSGWLAMPKRVQFSVWDAADPIVDTALFSFPLPGYRLFSHGLQAYNEPVHLGDRDGDPAGQRFYHNYGVDLAGYEGRQKVVSAIDGGVVQADSREGNLCIRDDRGLILHYGHLDSILTGIRSGVRVRRGEWVGMLGRQGASGNFSHLHVGVYLSETDLAADRPCRNLNLYPWLVAAYQAGRGSELHAMAGPHQTTFVGDPVRLDGRNSIAGPAEIASYRWDFQDGTSVAGPVAEKAFEKPGCYVAALWVTDSRGNLDVGFCRIKVFSRSVTEGVIPTLFVTHTPADGLRVNEPVNFRVWPQGMPLESIAIDFGDGTVVADYRPYSAITHTFATPGLHVVTAIGKAGALPVTQRIKTRVRE